jgi:hypothetical protein
VLKQAVVLTVAASALLLHDAAACKHLRLAYYMCVDAHVLGCYQQFVVCTSIVVNYSSSSRSSSSSGNDKLESTADLKLSTG